MMRYFKWFLIFVVVVATAGSMTGCTAMNATAQKISDDLGDKALQAHAFIDIWKVETSDATANGSPTGKKITIIGDVKSIPMVSKKDELVKNYGEYRKTITPAWYNSENVTVEESFIVTGDNVEELKKWYEARQKKEADAEKEKAAVK